MLEKVAIFFIFLGPLVFFHELGHFLFARLAGVRVETFSIGFGPKIFSFKKGDTVYAFSLIPLGGYVKMFGDDPLSDKELTPEEEALAYTKKGKWARFWIVFGGPLANFILAFFIYLSLITVGENVPQTRFGTIKADTSMYKAGVRTGDVLTKINSQEIVSYDDLNLIDSKVTQITVERTGEEVIIPYSANGMDFLKSYAKVNHPLRAPLVANAEGKSYLIKAVGQDKVYSLEVLAESKFQSFELYEVTGEIPSEFNPETIKTSKEIAATVSAETGMLYQALREQGFYLRELMIANIAHASPAAKAGLKGKELVVSVGGKDISNFTELRSQIQALKEEKPIAVKVLGKNGIRELELTPEFREANGVKYLGIGVVSAMSYYSIMVDVQTSGVFNIIKKAYNRTVEGTISTVMGFKKLITGEVSLKQVGGPIAIGQVASDSFNISMSMFFRLMAFISINLGIINLFPIPVLDGGHIVFIILEAINRGPLSRKKLMYAQQVGMSLLFLLIFVTLFNDISRFF